MVRAISVMDLFPLILSWGGSPGIRNNKGKVNERCNLKNNSILCDGLLCCCSGIALPEGLEISRDLPLQPNMTQILRKCFNWHPRKVS